MLADGVVRYRGEAVLALVGARADVLAIRDAEIPIAWTPEPPLFGIDAATAPDAPLVQADKPKNLLLDGGVKHGHVDGFAGCAAVAEGMFETAFVEHAYIEPEAGWARRVGDRIEIHASTQTPYMDRDEIASVMRLPPDVGAHRADRLRRRLRRQARSFGAAADRHRCLDARPAGRAGLYAAREHGRLDQAPSRAGDGQVRLRRRRASSWPAM